VLRVRLCAVHAYVVHGSLSAKLQGGSGDPDAGIEPATLLLTF